MIEQLIDEKLVELGYDNVSRVGTTEVTMHEFIVSKADRPGVFYELRTIYIAERSRTIILERRMDEKDSKIVAEYTLARQVEEGQDNRGHGTSQATTAKSQEQAADKKPGFFAKLFGK